MSSRLPFGVRGGAHNTSRVPQVCPVEAFFTQQDLDRLSEHIVSDRAILIMGKDTKYIFQSHKPRHEVSGVALSHRGSVALQVTVSECLDFRYLCPC